MTQDILDRLFAVSGLHWSIEPPRRHESNLTEYKMYKPAGGILTVICTPVAEDMPPQWSWTFFSTVDDEQAPVGACERRYLALRASGFAETPEEAATTAMAYQPEEREMVGVRWYGTVNGHHAHSGQSWISAVAGAEVEIRSSNSSTGFRWTHSLPALASIVHMIEGAQTYDPSLAGESSTLEVAAADAIAAPGRLRQAIAAVSGSLNYQRGFDDGRDETISRLVKFAFYRASDAERQT
jgi:hypothetical protein